MAVMKVKYLHYTQARALVMSLLRYDKIVKVQRDNMASFFSVLFSNNRMIYFSPYYEHIEVSDIKEIDNKQLAYSEGEKLAILTGKSHKAVFNSLKNAMLHFMERENYPGYMIESLQDDS